MPSASTIPAPMSISCKTPKTTMTAQGPFAWPRSSRISGLAGWRRFPDYELDAYRELTSRVNIPVLPSGNWFQDPPLFHAALRSGAWRVARTDSTVLGGITPREKR